MDFLKSSHVNCETCLKLTQNKSKPKIIENNADYLTYDEDDIEVQDIVAEALTNKKKPSLPVMIPSFTDKSFYKTMKSSSKYCPLTLIKKNDCPLDLSDVSFTQSLSSISASSSLASDITSFSPVMVSPSPMEHLTEITDISPPFSPVTTGDSKTSTSFSPIMIPPSPTTQYEVVEQVVPDNTTIIQSSSSNFTASEKSKNSKGRNSSSLIKRKKYDDDDDSQYKYTYSHATILCLPKKIAPISSVSKKENLNRSFKPSVCGNKRRYMRSPSIERENDDGISTEMNISSLCSKCPNDMIIIDTLDSLQKYLTLRLISIDKCKKCSKDQFIVDVLEQFQVFFKDFIDNSNIELN